MQALNGEISRFALATIDVSLGRGVIVCEVNMQHRVPPTREFPAQLNLKSMPAKLIHKNSHDSSLASSLKKTWPAPMNPDEKTNRKNGHTGPLLSRDIQSQLRRLFAVWSHRCNRSQDICDTVPGLTTPGVALAQVSLRVQKVQCAACRVAARVIP
jgi:hypothetical protein